MHVHNSSEGEDFDRASALNSFSPSNGEQPYRGKIRPNSKPSLKFNGSAGSAYQQYRTPPIQLGIYATHLTNLDTALALP